ncbi:MAG TPA: glycine cleavage system protein GcvH [Thiolapillus brandeum]|uniref:Glycine cleavage system H protein n=1 Tax=Thiolapillus brandeum TaxID=1076588 RepID=A0A831WCG4_9GAMM|nr:glycine cleavage system protein GcvH [Thiolapillus brandeum]
MSNPEDCLFHQEHMWCRCEADNHLVIGVSHHAQTSLGEVVFVELPEPGSSIRQGEALGIIESVKVVNDLIAPADGTVVEVNEQLAETPTTVNDDPYGHGWMLRIKMESQEQLAELMNETDYLDSVKG